MSKESSDVEQHPFSPVVKEFLRVNGDASDTMKQAVELWSKQVQQTQEGLPAFFQKRLSEDAHWMEVVLNSHDVNTMAMANLEFMKKSVADYSDFLAQICGDALCTANEFWKPFLNGFGVGKEAQPEQQQKSSNVAHGGLNSRRAA